MKRVFFDVDTQLDFLLPGGALYVPGAEKRIAAIARLNRYAAEHGFPIISTMDAHTENDPEFALWPPHCVQGCLGQRKPAETILPEGAGQIFLEKVTTDCFSNPELPAILDRLGADEYIVYGVVTEICVKNALFGLLKTGRRVVMVADAVEELDRAAAEAMKREFQAAGGGISTAFA
jgi:nicotinamidase/pyrazinamidase